MAKPQQGPRPWEKYPCEARRLLQPGWGGSQADGELRFIQDRLKADPMLAYWWGFRPGQKTRSVEALRRIAMYGSPEVRAANVK